jgi:hypothetical protein
LCGGFFHIASRQFHAKRLSPSTSIALLRTGDEAFGWFTSVRIAVATIFRLIFNQPKR